MKQKREEARSKAVVTNEHADDVMAALRGLGFKTADARRALDYCETIPVTSLEDRIRASLIFLRPRARVELPAGAS